MSVSPQQASVIKQAFDRFVKNDVAVINVPQLTRQRVVNNTNVPIDLIDLDINGVIDIMSQAAPSLQISQQQLAAGIRANIPTSVVDLNSQILTEEEQLQQQLVQNINNVSNRQNRSFVYNQNQTDGVILKDIMNKYQLNPVQLLSLGRSIQNGKRKRQTTEATIDDIAAMTNDTNIQTQIKSIAPKVQEYLKQLLVFTVRTNGTRGKIISVKPQINTENLSDMERYAYRSARRISRMLRNIQASKQFSAKSTSDEYFTARANVNLHKKGNPSYIYNKIRSLLNKYNTTDFSQISNLQQQILDAAQKKIRNRIVSKSRLSLTQLQSADPQEYQQYISARKNLQQLSGINTTKTNNDQQVLQYLQQLQNS